MRHIIYNVQKRFIKINEITGGETMPNHNTSDAGWALRSVSKTVLQYDCLG